MAANVHSLVQYWKNFDLPRVQKELDVTATDLANRQDESDASRKRLVELSREFKKNTPEDIRETVAPLLKSFQTEVDNLCKRSKAAEAAFLAVYKKIVDVPDPVPVLEHCLTLQQRAHKAHELDIENKQLRETLNDYNQEFKDAKKHEVTIKQLQQKLQEYEERTEDTFLSRVHEKEQELRQQFQERERQLLESLHAVSKKLEDAEQKIAELQSALESTQPELFDLKAKQHDATHAKSDEMEIIMNDLERANQRAALAEKEVAQLKEQLTATKRSLQLADQIQKAPDMEQAVDVVARSSLEVELAAKEKEISQLVDDIQRLQSTISTLKETTSAQIAQLEEMLTEKNTIIRHLEEKLERQKDYEDIKRELSILKSMEFPADSAPNLPSSDEQGPVDAKSSPKPLDVLLLEKNKSLQNENSALKTGNSDVSDSAENPFLPPLQTVETFGSILGEEIVSTFTKLMKKEERNGSPAPPSASPDDVKAPGSQKPSGGTCSSAMSSTTTTTTSVSSSSSNSGGNSPYVNGNTGMKPVTEDTTSILSTTPTKEPSMENASFEKLQECLRHNVEKYINESLNTLSISRCVRELLSVHNIGQRLFAKYVLGLSQGTVSELLSKPKPWDKLTEKGRDSYRKMHAWAADESCIYLLKALVPRKAGKIECCISSKSVANHSHLSAGTKFNPFSVPKNKSCKDTGMTPFRQEDTGTEERIAQILSEAQQAMCNKNCKSLTSTTPPTSLHNGIGNLPSASDGKVSDKPATENAMDQGGVEGGGGENGGGGNKSPHPNHTFRDCLSSPRRCRKYENDDIPQEMVARIYQEELAKLMGQQGAGEEFRPSRDQYERTQEEIRQALSIYHQELSRLSQMGPPTTSDALSRFSSVSTLSQAGLLNGTTCANFVSLAAHVGSGAPRLDMPLDARMAARVSNQHEPRPGCCPQSDSLRHHGSAFSLVRPKTEPTTPGAITKSGFSSTTSSNPSSAILPLTETSPGEDMGSPLQRMQSITNSLLSQSSMPSLPTPPQRPSKAVLPPITQQQFDQYNNLNTEDIVKKVKEQLSQYSISQRLFGESVLGLSQGSVSDLLARPKPWHMLTQKGREPFIRMKIFLEDDNAVHKLVASQYKIAPEKLMRTGGFAGITPSPVTSSKPSPRPSEPSPAPVIKTETNRSAVSPSYSSHSDPPRSSSSTPEGGGTPAPPLPLPVSTPSTNPALPGGGSAVARRAHHTRSLAYMQPSVYEMAALTTDLDTQSITTRIKETLMAHNIGQKIFGEAVLGLSQGSVSELLSKPKPWHMLSIKGREPFIRMQLWLNDPHNVEKLQALKNERREANKRRRSNIELPETAGSMKTDNHVYNFSYAPSPTYPAAKKPRILFSEEQKEALRLAFSMDPYPSTATIEFLANELNLSVRTITNWFHNHRMRLKQHNPSASQDDQRSDSGSGSGNPTVAALPYLTGVREGAAFDPVHFRRMLSQRLLDLRQEKNSSFRGGSGMMVVPYGYMSYGNTGNSSPLSTQGDDTGTLDLSMSSQQRSRLQANKTDTSFSGADDRSSSEINDDSNMSQDQGAATEGSDHDSVEDQQAPLRSPTLHQKHLTEQWKRAPLPAPTVVPTVGSASSGSSSNRRKPAMPQWVNPGLEMSPDSDVQSDEEEEYDDSQEEIINGVCVRQTDGGFDLRMTKEETVRIEPAPAPDQAMVDHSPRGGALKSRKAEATTAAAPAAEEDDEEEAEEKEMDGVDAEDEEDEEEEEIEASDLRVRSVVSAEVELERRNNIKRLERSLNEQEESWDVVDADDDRQSNIEKMQQRLEKEDREDWEF